MTNSLAIHVTPVIAVAIVDYRAAVARSKEAGEKASKAFRDAGPEEEKVRAAWRARNPGVMIRALDNDPEYRRVMHTYDEAWAARLVACDEANSAAAKLASLVKAELSKHEIETPTATVHTKGKKWQYVVGGEKARVSGASAHYTTVSIVLRAIITRNDSGIVARWECGYEYSSNAQRLQGTIARHTPHINSDRHNLADLNLLLAWRVIPIVQEQAASV